MAVVAGVGGVAASGAVNPQLVPSETLITPCRIMDTRSGPANVGPRNTPLAGGETYTIQVTGVNGNCVIPPDAGGVVMNVTVVGPQTNGFVTVFPGGATRPTASNLNYSAGQAPVPNQVTVALGDDGQVSFFASGGPVNLVADIAGYTTRPRLTSEQLAELDWGADRGKAARVSVGTFPFGMASDGSSVWVANRGDNTVSRIDPASDLETAVVNLGGGANPFAVAYGDGSIWVTNEGPDTVTRIDPVTATIVATIPLASGSNPFGLVFGAGRIWVAQSSLNTVVRIDPATNTLVAGAVTVGTSPQGVAFGAGRVWVTNTGSGSLSAINTLNLAVNTVSVGVSSQPAGVLFDGANVWTANFGTNTVARVNPTPVVPSVTDAISVGTSPTFLAFDGAEVWVTNQGSATVSRIDAGTLAVTGSVPVGVSPRGIVFDGSNVWVASFNLNRVEKIRTG